MLPVMWLDVKEVRLYDLTKKLTILNILGSRSLIEARTNHTKKGSISPQMANLDPKSPARPMNEFGHRCTDFCRSPLLESRFVSKLLFRY